GSRQGSLISAWLTNTRSLYRSREQRVASRTAAFAAAVRNLSPLALVFARKRRYDRSANARRRVFAAALETSRTASDCFAQAVAVSSPAAALSASARSVRSQVKVSPSRPKWP